MAKSASLLVLLLAISPSFAQGKDSEPLKDIGTRKQGVDWPQFLGPTQDSKSSEKGIIKKWPREGLRIVWQRKLGTSYGIGSVSKGRYYQFDRIDDKAILFCLNAETGKELWNFSYATDYTDSFGYEGGPRCSPVIDGNRVYIYGAAGQLYCLNATNGKRLWHRDTMKEFGVSQNFFGVGSTPTIEGNLLLTMVGGSAGGDGNQPIDEEEGNGTGVIAFDKYTGKVRYKIGKELASYAAIKLATIDKRRWGFAFVRSGLLAFEPKTGKIDFHYPWRAKIVESVNASTPVVVKNEVFISETYGPGSSLLKVAPGKHEVVWKDSRMRREKAMQAHWNTPIFHKGYLYGCSGRHTANGELRCVEWKTGKVMWSRPGLSRSSLLYVDEHFICLDEYGRIHMFPATEKEHRVAGVAIYTDPKPLPDTDRRLPLLKYPCWAAPILSHGLMYVRGADRVLCLELIPEKQDKNKEETKSKGKEKK